MKITAIQCKVCGDIIWSRAEYDYHYCTCESVAIDGGVNPHKFVGNRDDYEIKEIELDITEDDAHDDWNNRTNKLGIIHTKDETEFIGNI